jgi:hypothetical protein
MGMVLDSYLPSKNGWLQTMTFVGTGKWTNAVNEKSSVAPFASACLRRTKI